MATDSTAGCGTVRSRAVGAEGRSALIISGDSWLTDNGLADPARFVGALSAEFGAARDSPRGEFRFTPAGAAGDDTSSAERARAAGGSAGTAVAAAAGTSVWAAVGTLVRRAVGTSVWSGVSSSNELVSILDARECVRLRFELGSASELGSVLAALRREEVELV
ncbi:MAG: hypothetical protein ACPGVG_13420 [Mycobacterium sp.]